MDEAERIKNELIAALGRAMKTMPEPAGDSDASFDAWPRIHMNVMYRYLAAEAGFPKRCGDRRCRRKGHCHGGLGEKDCHTCDELWSEADLGKLEAACLALLLGWRELQSFRTMGDMLFAGSFLTESTPAELSA